MVLKIIGAIVVIWLGLALLGWLVGAFFSTLSTIATVAVVGAIVYFLYKAFSKDEKKNDVVGPY
ncbi:hypothetical protein ONR57_11035 [Hoyosella sp. YIM 151337]|uniref:hypothetical protein n=1 Tax=Hoyosella sp. YIM 151337 TaxID=2992742 RepID=UPI0022365CC6|nr:hypothetical protein [Hoyosella sp. YIM 151337]MCW4353832.1 hypothetical protein [Hoyosella sp. YIM 151337]